MLTRLKVSGFKNLVDVDVRFGPFTCIAGVNAVGKSNLFDAISFLSALADHPLIEAALSVRDEGGRTSELRSLFHRVGDQYAEEMSFEAEMIVPPEGLDELGQLARATSTFLRYSLVLGYRAGDSLRSQGLLELLKEELTYIRIGDAARQLLFSHSPAWRASAVTGRRWAAYISTEGEGPNRVINLHQDGRHGGRSLGRLAANLTRTILSATNAAESPTALMARREMRSWRSIHLEPSALRRPDEFTAPTTLGVDGSHLPATLYHLARSRQHLVTDGQTGAAAEAQVYGQVANRLAELIDDVRAVTIDRDEKRELLTLYVTDRDGTSHPARALSDGTLRFLALAVLQLDPESSGLWCLEEPENGIHPERIPAMLELLQDIATDVEAPVGPDNPLRQVIINTHSPSVVTQVPDDSLLVAEFKEAVSGGQRFKRVSFSSLPKTWRLKAIDAPKPVARGALMTYLNPYVHPDRESSRVGNGSRSESSTRDRSRPRRVIDRSDLQLMLPLEGALGD
jgi:predicted ATPase